MVEMNPMSSSCFVLRRAFWNGVVVRSDIEDAFNVSSATAGRILTGVCHRYSDCLNRLPRKVRPRLQAPAPPIAHADQFFRLIARGEARFAELGLRPDEITVTYSSLNSTCPPDGKIGGLLIRALRHTGPVDIRYVGLKRGATGEWRTVVPVSLEMFQGQWRVHAHDLGDEGKLKTFVLTRLLDAARSDARIPRSLIVQTGAQLHSRYQISFNTLLTPDQRQVLRQEMRADKNDVVSLSSGEAFEFRRKYTDSEIKAQHNMTWPLVSDLKLMER